MTKRDKCAGGIIILPSFSNLTNLESYKVLIVKQKYNNYWGLPKGHIEEEETIYTTALREIKEEANLDISSLIREVEYDEILLPRGRNHANNLVIVKKIYFFAFVLLQEGHAHIQAGKRIRNREICEIKWISFSQLKTNSLHLKFNRTLCVDSIHFIEQLLHATKLLLSEKYRLLS